MPRSKHGEFAQTLGTVLRRHRRAGRWSRAQLLARMGTGLSTQSVAAYERGTRTLTVFRLIELCHSMDKNPVAVMSEAYGQVFDPTEYGLGAIRVNLTLLARATHPELQPQRRWAATRVRELRPHRDVAISLAPHALDTLTALCGTDRDELLRLLTGYLEESP